MKVLRELPDNSVHAVVTDPPYGLSKEPDIIEVLTKWMAGEDYTHRGGGFMGKTWDSFVPGPAVWREVYRVLKPGGHALVFAGTRTQDLMTVSLRMAGFEVRDVIEWLYFSGFPKSHDVGKAFDRRNGSSLAFREESEKFGAYLKERRTAKRYSMKYIDEQLGLNTSYSWWEGRKSGVQPPSKRNYLRLKPILELDDRFDLFIDRVEAEREKVGEYKGVVKGGVTYSAGFGNGAVGEASTVEITKPATELARKWDGWGTALKPAHEPIIVARKPLAGTVADNVEKYGTGGINIDGTRIGRLEGDRFEYGVDGDEQNTTGESGIYGKYKPCAYNPHEAGRFPANCVTTDADAFYSPYFNVTPRELSKKASKKDRNSDWKGESIVAEEKTTDDGRKKPIDNPFLRGETKRVNSHPTVKPIELMAWLVRLVTPPGGIVLDPFAGSGTTPAAAKREGFDFIAIEQSDEYAEIARKRTGTEAM
jgi:DNA modification methylase